MHGVCGATMKKFHFYYCWTHWISPIHRKDHAAAACVIHLTAIEKSEVDCTWSATPLVLYARILLMLLRSTVSPPCGVEIQFKSCCSTENTCQSHHILNTTLRRFISDSRRSPQRGDFLSHSSTCITFVAVTWSLGCQSLNFDSSFVMHFLF